MTDKSNKKLQGRNYLQGSKEREEGNRYAD